MDDLLTSPGDESHPLPPTKKKGKVKSFQCPACGGVVTIHAVGHSINAVCSHCSSVVNIANDNYKVIEKANKLTRPTLLEMGTRGNLFGVTWEIIGYVAKNDGSSAYRWDEYLLYNPYHGFRFLILDRGHWNFFAVIKRAITSADLSDEILLDEQKYAIFHRGEAVVEYVKGEAYWSIKKGERVRVADYIAPPHILSVERNQDEIVVALGEYLQPDEVKEAFKLTSSMPYPIGVAANQVSPFQNRITGILSIAVIGLLVATLIQIMTSTFADNAEVYATRSHIYSDNPPPELTANGCAETGGADCGKSANYGKNKIFSTPSFTLPKRSNLFIESFSPLQNDWAEFHLSLVNEQTNTAYSLSHAIEHYSGSDSDGYWSEGNQTVAGYISAVPRGTYRLLVEADSGAFQNNRGIDFFVNIKRDVPVWGNYWVTLLLLVFYPIYAGIRHMSFENKRWAESDYAPALYRPRED